MHLIGVDTGGTFTDFIYYKSGQLHVHKVLSTPEAPEKAILQGLAALNVDFSKLHIIHGSTVATNAVLEGKGVKTVYIGNAGLKDVLLIGRQARESLYDLQPVAKPSLINPQWCLEVSGRLNAQGELLDAPDAEELSALTAKIQQINPQAVAINLLFSYLNDEVERQIENALPASLFVSRSSAVLAEYKEYERGMATWLNAYIGPLVQGYLKNLQAKVKPASLSVMLSTGGTASAEQAGNKAVNMLLSGPAGGLQAAKTIGAQLGQNKLLTLDMGGTSTDVALIDGEIKLTTEAKINNMPVAVPMVDMHTIGAGGGSIAYLDDGGLLQVGPRSAGANPGPACYGKGGKQLTVTDANLIMGYLPEEISLGGYLTLDRQAALNAAGPLAAQMQSSVYEVAQGVLQIANEHMAQALRVISVQKGIDPGGFTLVSFGGAGALHVCDLAEAMGMHKAILPIHGGVLSAFGMLVAPVSRELSLTHMVSLAELNDQWMQEQFKKLHLRGEKEMQDEGLAGDDLISTPSLDLRYLGQSYSLNVPWRGIENSIQYFHQIHRQRYGHDMQQLVELVNIRLSLKGQSRSLSQQKNPKNLPAEPIKIMELHADKTQLPLYERKALAKRQKIHGPAIIIEDVATIFVKSGWLCEVHESGHIQLFNQEN